MFISPAQAARQLALRKAKARGQALPFKLDEFLFPEQLAFVSDPARFVTACCSVRSGKTTSCAADLINTALSNSYTVGLYITLVRATAKRILWPELKHINRTYKLGIKFNENALSAHFANGSIVYLLGSDTASEIEKIRGLSNVILCYLDEAQAFRSHIKELVEDVLTKRLYDTNGRLRLIGTPGPMPKGYFYEACHSSTWAHHSWTMHQNPWLFKKSGKTPAELIAQDCAQWGVALSDPAIQRECFGVWARDLDSLLLVYDEEKNDYTTLPPGSYTYILGVDLGWSDSDSLSLLAFKDNDPTTYLVEEVITAGQLTDDLAKQIGQLQADYPNLSAMPADAGGLGKKTIEDLKARFGLPLTPADKRDKLSNYRLLNNALRNGTFRAKKTSRFAQDCSLLQKDREKSTPDRIVIKGHSDAVDSTLYAFKLSPAYSFMPVAVRASVNSPEWIKAQEALHVQAALDKVKREQDAAGGKSEYGSWNKDAKGVASWFKW